MLKQFVPEGFCLKCRGCCRFKEPDSIWSPTLLHEEIKPIIPFANLYSKKIRLTPSAEKLNNFICPFLNSEGNRCNIYANRPFECQLYPFLINKKEDKAFLALDLNCPFIKENSGSSVLKEYSRELAQLFSSRQCKKLFKDNPQVIQAYPEATNLEEIII
ncbi:MAG: YkgJ family cysteine cluster protein [Candidatus Omnitrophota bacterium]